VTGLWVGRQGSIPDRSKEGIIFLFTSVHTGSGAHPASYPMGIGCSLPVIKRPGREADHSAQSSGRVKNVWSYTSTQPYVIKGYVLMVQYLVKHRHNFMV